jgi:hypothetical protein
VLCTSGHACAAVGQCGGGVSASLAERWDGRRWAVQSTPGPPGNAARLRGSPAPRPRPAPYIAPRGVRLLALAERWNGVRWARQPTPPAVPGAGGVLLNAVGCSPTAACTAVGQAGSGPPVIERQNGIAWVMQRSPPVRNPGPGQLASVSCPAAGVCVAAGNTGGSEPPDFSALALAERWNGKTWAIQRPPERPGTLPSSPTGIACSSPVAYTAVGEAVLGQPAGTVTLAERWNGTWWAIQHTPNPPHGNLPGAPPHPQRGLVPVGHQLRRRRPQRLRGTSRAVERQDVGHPAPARVAQAPGRGAASCIAAGCPWPLPGQQARTTMPVIAAPVTPARPLTPAAVRAWVIFTSPRNPGAGMLDRLTRSQVLRLSRLEEVKDVLRARCRPKSEEMVIRIGEGPTAADRHEARVSDLREDHGWHSFLHPPNTRRRRTRDQARPQVKPANPVVDPQARRLHGRIER